MVSEDDPIGNRNKDVERANASAGIYVSIYLSVHHNNGCRICFLGFPKDQGFAVRRPLRESGELWMHHA